MFSNLVTIKVTALLLLGFLKLIVGLSPIIFSDYLKNFGERWVKVATSLALCFGGGVLFASCMLHMIPKVRDSLDLMNWKSSFPLAEFIVCCGFFVVFFIEEFVLSFTRDTNFRSIEADIRINGRVEPPPNDLIKSNYESSTKANHVFVLMALFLHSTLEGLAVGLQLTSRGVWLLFAAIMTHAAFVVFSIGLKLFSDGVSELKMFFYMMPLSLSSPVGGVIGLILTVNNKNTKDWSIVILEGLCAGALLFVTFFEVLENEKKKGGFIRLFCVVFGFAMTAVLQIFGMNLLFLFSFFLSKKYYTLIFDVKNRMLCTLSFFFYQTSYNLDISIKFTKVVNV